MLNGCETRSPSLADKASRTPLHVACANGDQVFARLLLDFGASVSQVYATSFFQWVAFVRCDLVLMHKIYRFSLYPPRKITAVKAEYKHISWSINHLTYFIHSAIFKLKHLCDPLNISRYSHNLLIIADFRQADSRGRSALHYAAELGWDGAVRAILSSPVGAAVVNMVGKLFVFMKFAIFWTTDLCLWMRLK